jgi:hypothetical protein
MTRWRDRCGNPIDHARTRSLPMCLAPAWRRFAGETLETLTLVCQRFCAVALLVHDCNKYGRTLEASMLNAHTRLAREADREQRWE